METSSVLFGGSSGGAGPSSARSFVALALSRSQETRFLLTFIGVQLALFIAQSAYGVYSDSLGLLAGAFHAAFHCTALLTALWGTLHARSGGSGSSTRARTFAFSYGFERYEVLASFSNALFLIFVCLFVFTGALHRLVSAGAGSVSASHLPARGGAGSGSAESSTSVSAGVGASLVFGLIGAAVNIGGVLALGPSISSIEQVLRYQLSLSAPGALVTSISGGVIDAARQQPNFQKNGSSLPLNSTSGVGSIPSVRSVAPQDFADALSPLAVVASAFAQRNLGVRSADALQAAFVTGLTLYIAVPLFRATGLLLLQTTPPTLRAALERCRREALTVDGVCEVTDERWWSQSPGFAVGSLVVRVRADASEREVLARLQRAYGRFISDLTIQVEKDPPLAWLMGEASAVGLAGGDVSVVKA